MPVQINLITRDQLVEVKQSVPDNKEVHQCENYEFCCQVSSSAAYTVDMLAASSMRRTLRISLESVSLPINFINFMIYCCETLLIETINYRDVINNGERYKVWRKMGSVSEASVWSVGCIMWRI